MLRKHWELPGESGKSGLLEAEDFWREPPIFFPPFQRNPKRNEEWLDLSVKLRLLKLLFPSLTEKLPAQPNKFTKIFMACKMKMKIKSCRN
jgi:hypothetical protein